MNIAVRYHSRTGNTKKVALAIAEEAGVTAQDLSAPLDEKADVLFLGSAIYAAGIDSAVKRFIQENKDKIGIIYNLSTTALLKSTYKKVKKAATKSGVAIAGQEFYCRGRFKGAHKDRPNDDDLKNAKIFAREALQNHE